MKHLITFIFFTPVLCFAQLPEKCGVSITKPQWHEFHRATNQTELKSWNDDTVNIPVKIHIVRDNFGNPAVDTSEIRLEIDSVNFYFKNANVQFFICEVNYIDNPNLLIFDSPNEEDLLASYGEDDRLINLYYVEELYLENVRVCGFAYFPPGPNRIFIDAFCINLGNTLTHELGHYFGLLHTHGLSNINKSLELVDRTNCDKTGDNLCDTPADPNLTNKVDNNCVYTEGELDWKLAPYNPMTHNIMSYSNSNCIDTLTEGQYQVIRNSLFKFGRINYSCTKMDDVFNKTEIVTINPNPIVDDVIFDIQMAKKETARLSIIDLKGVEIQVLLLSTLQKGNNRKYFNIDHLSLSKGFYFLQLITESGSFDSKPLLIWE